MKKICKSCKKEFEIEKEDFNFYELVNAPIPENCPDCRLQNRLLWRNEKALYYRVCDLCDKKIISIYSVNKPFKIYCRECFHGDNWDALSFGLSVDFSKSFLEQFRELQLKVPRISSFVFQNTLSEYVNGAAFNKNCYMIFVSDHNEDTLYSYATFNSRTSVDLLNCDGCEICYECITCIKCYRTAFSEDCSNSQDLLFCKNLTNCQNCIGCVNLRNVNYAIFNQVYSKEEYIKKVAELGLNSGNGLEKIKNQTDKFFTDFPVKYFHGLRNINFSGDYVSNSKNAQNVFDSEELEDSKFINHGSKAKDSYDSYVLVDKSEKAYEVVSGITVNNVQYSYCVWHAYDVFYSDTCENSNNLFGCVGLRKKEYCILNKQYSKESFDELRTRIIAHMKIMPFIDKNGKTNTYGDFFPSSFSPFAYNETVVQEYFPLYEQQAKEQGFTWQKEEQKKYEPTIKSEDIPNEIQKVKDTITEEILECMHKGSCNDKCTTAFRITQKELELYRRLNLPLPTFCFNCRHEKRLKKRNPRKLWHRQCMCGSASSPSTMTKHGHEGICKNEFETSYAPDRPEIVFCEQCYQQEVS